MSDLEMTVVVEDADASDAVVRGPVVPAARTGGKSDLVSLFDVTLPVSIEIGRTQMTVEQVLKLGRGSVVELERLAGEPIDIYVGDLRFAQGEVVVVGENFGVRITQVLASGIPEVELAS